MYILTCTLLVSAFFGSALSWGDIYLFHLSVFACIVMIFASREFRALCSYNFQINKPWIFLGLYSLLSIAWAPRFAEALKYNAYLGCGLSLIYLVPFLTNKFAIKPLQILQPIYLLHLIISLLEISTPFRWPISEYSKLNYLFGRMNLDFPSFFEKYPTSFFWHQNNCALVTLVALPLILKSSSKFKFMILGLSYLIILSSGSKSVFVLSILWGASQLVIKLWKDKISVKNLFLGIVAIFSIGICSYVFTNSEQRNELSQSLLTVRNYVNPSFEFGFSQVTDKNFDYQKLHINIRERYYLMDGALKLYKQSPFLGAGAGAHLDVSHSVDGKNVLITSIHNFWLELFTTYGFFVILYFYGFFFAAKKSNTYRTALLLFFLGAPVLSSGIYFLPGWLLISLAQSDKKDAPSHSI